MVDGLRRIGLGVGAPPTGAFYVLANARRFTSDSLAFAFEILDRAHVGVTPGVDFGRNAEGYLRFSYAQSVERIQEALRPPRPLPLRARMTAEPCVMCDKYGRSDGPLHVADLTLSRVFLHEDQFFPGYVLLVLRRHVTELYDLPEPERAALMEEVSRVAQALARSFRPSR